MKAISVATAAFLALATACSNTADGVKKDAQVAAEKTAEAAAKTGTAVGGALETGQVKTAILADTLIDASHIDVDTDEAGKTVTLRGTVPTGTQKSRAADIAREKATGYSVVNNLTVKQP